MLSKIRNSKTLIVIMSLVLSISMMSISFMSVHAVEYNKDLVELANEYIVKITDNDELVPVNKYTGIQEFVEKARTYFPNLDDVSLARFIYEYTGHGSSEDFPDDIIIEALEYIEVVVQDEYMMVTKSGDTVTLSEEQAIKSANGNFDDSTTMSVKNGSIVAPQKTVTTWTSSNGYMKIRTAYELVKESGKKRYYSISATGTWLKMPAFRYSDIICISNTATYDDSHNDYACYKQSFSCLSNDLKEHTKTAFKVEIDTKGTHSDSGIEFGYQSVNGASALVDLKTFICGKSGVDAHIQRMNYMEAYIKYRIICTAGNSYNIQGAYCHSRGGLSDPSVSFSGVNISFSLVGAKDEYKARPVTINA